MDEYLDDDFVLATSEVPDPLDAEDFKPVDYINRQFPNKEALKSLDSFVDQLKGQKRQIDEDIRLAIRRQAMQQRQARADLDEAKAAAGELLERMKAIRAKAEQSEDLVSDVNQDMKNNNIAQRNLTLTITALKRFVMLVTALEQLRALAREQRYEDVAGLIYVVEELAGHFRELSHVSKVTDLLEQKAGVVGDLRKQLLEHYATILGTPTSAMELPSGWASAPARCVDALGPSMQREVVSQVCLHMLHEYKDIFQPPKDFQPPKENSGLERVERRFAWLNRRVNEYQNKHASNFPDAWRVPCCICVHFCQITRQHLVEILGTSHLTVDPELLVSVLIQCIKFEKGPLRKYIFEDPCSANAGRNDGVAGYLSCASVAALGLKYPDVLGKPVNQAAGPSAAENLEDFTSTLRIGIISECFYAYLSTWVVHEENQLSDVLDRSTAQGTDKIEDGFEDDDGGFEPRHLYSSAPALFASMKSSIDKCAEFSTQNTMFDIFQSCRKVVSRYCERLERLLGSGGPLDSAGVETVCCVYGTADYCLETLSHFCDSVQEVISPEFQERVTFENEQELLRNLMNNANKTLMQSVNHGAFSQMKRNKWPTFYQDVGDQSVCIRDLPESLSKHLDPVARHLSKIHFRAFCNHFVQAFLERFVEEIFKCGNISEQGAQQLFVDTDLVKTTLLEAPVIAGNGQQMPTAYSKLVFRKIDKAETKLKVLTSPDIEDAAAMLLGSDGASPEAVAEMERLLALRGTKDGEPGSFWARMLPGRSR